MATVYDVAEKAGVSIGTVSRILNKRRDGRPFAEKTITRVKKAADELGYRPHYHARSLMTGKAGAIGFLLGLDNSTSWNEFWAQMVGGMISESETRNYHFVTLNCMPDMTKADTGLQFLNENKIDALIVPSFDAAPEAVGILEECGYPVVLLYYPGTTDLPVVDVDDVTGVDKLLEHLQALGHKDILWVGPKKGKDVNIQRRLKRFRELTGEMNMTSSELLCKHHAGDTREIGNRKIETVKQAMSEYLKKGSEFTAAVCYEEHYSIGVYKALHEAGLSVPEDVSVTGFDDVFAPYMTPSLTVASFMLEKIGKKAVEIAADIIKDKKNIEKHRNERVLVDPEIIIRESTGPVGLDRSESLVSGQ